MKSLLVFSLTAVAISSVGHAAPARCFSLAERAVRSQSEIGQYDQDGIRAATCGLASNGKVMICEVDALKGDGAALDSYRVVLNASCTRVFRVDLTGEE